MNKVLAKRTKFAVYPQERGCVSVLEGFIHVILPPIIALLELIGIFVVTVGALTSFWHYLLTFFGKRKYAFKFELANSMATGLEFKMAAEILKTVIVRDLGELLILGSIILLRALLSFMIHVEIKASSEHE